MPIPNMETPEDVAMGLPIRARDDVCMELHATGFNAWNQFSFDTPLADLETTPDDVFSFTKIIGGQTLDRPEPTLCYTKVRRDGQIQTAGGQSIETDWMADIINRMTTVQGGNNVLSYHKNDGSLYQYEDYYAMYREEDNKTWPWKARTTQLAGSDVGFVMLKDHATVFTMGDPRYPDCLGRDITDSSPADQPGEVTDLSTLGEGIKKVAAGGYTIAALTETGALYIWGALPPLAQVRHHVFPDISRIPNYIQVDGEKDVMDVGLGEYHAIALTADGCVYVIGGNFNGQLGLGGDGPETAENWTKVDFKVRQGWEIIGVEAGERSSFIMTAKKLSED